MADITRNWITDVAAPKIRSLLRRGGDSPTSPEGLWLKCPITGELEFHKDVENNMWVFPKSGYHMRMPVKARFDSLFDKATYTIIPQPTVPEDPLKFRDSRKYIDRLRDARTKCGRSDALETAVGSLNGQRTVISVHDFDFLGGSMGLAVGESFVLAAEQALKEHCPLVIFTSSGGARMQEGMFSLMQMPRTTIMIHRLKQAKIPYLVVLTNPTTGGVTASYAMLGDIHIAEPGALIGFAGARVIEQTIRGHLPEGFQRAEYLLAHGMIDMVVSRKHLRDELAKIFAMLFPRYRHVAA